MGNLKISKEDGSVSISINPKIYPLEIIYSAAYVFIDKAYVLIEGDPKKNVIVELIPKEVYDLLIPKSIKLKSKKDNDTKSILEQFGREFNNELLSYATYATIARKNKGIMTTLIQRALLTNEGEPEESINMQEDNEFKEILKELEEDKDMIKDKKPFGIQVPWDEEELKEGSKKEFNEINKKFDESLTKSKIFNISYDGQKIKIKNGESIIDACEKFGVPFGCERGTCGSCKISIIKGSKNLSKLTKEEKDLGGDSKIRFACQCKLIGGDVEINY